MTHTLQGSIENYESINCFAYSSAENKRLDVVVKISMTDYVSTEKTIFRVSVNRTDAIFEYGNFAEAVKKYNEI